METLRNALLAAAVAIVGYHDTPVLLASASSAPSRASEAREPVAAIREITIPAGTALSLQLGSTVSSATSRIEQPVNATLRRALVVDGITIAPAGAPISGYVSHVQRSGRVKGRASIGVRFNRLRVGDAVVLDTHGKHLASRARDEEGGCRQIGIGAGAGALVGALTGGKKGAAIGTGVGAAGGSAVVLRPAARKCRSAAAPSSRPHCPRR